MKLEESPQSVENTVAFGGGSRKWARLFQQEYVCNPSGATTMEKTDLVGQDLVFDLLDRFFSTTDPDERARRMSTTEMFACLAEHAPDLFTHTDVYLAMSQFGFKTEMVGNELKWLVRSRSTVIRS